MTQADVFDQSRMEARRPPPPFPLSVVTGFLGAGKTTLLNRLLRDPALADTLVLINEFGAVGLDHLLVERVEGDMLVMTSGCLCCSIRGDLIAALEDALRARDNGRMSPFERVIIETTGLADPAPVLHIVMAHPYLRMRFRLQTVVTLVDAVLGAATLDAHVEAVKQVGMADRLVLTKRDLADDADVQALTARLRCLNPAAPILVSDEADPAQLFGGTSYDPSTLSGDVREWLAAEAYDAETKSRQADHAHNGHAGHRHDVNRHDDRIRAFCLRHPRAVSPQAVALFTELLRSAHGAKVLRFKGLIALSDDPGRPLVVHSVQHVAHPPQRLSAWPDADHTTRMVFILNALDPAFVEALWAAAIGEPRIDTADFATRAANPLAPSPGGLLG